MAVRVKSTAISLPSLWLLRHDDFGLHISAIAAVCALTTRITFFGRQNATHPPFSTTPSIEDKDSQTPAPRYTTLSHSSTTHVLTNLPHAGRSS